MSNFNCPPNDNIHHVEREITLEKRLLSLEDHKTKTENIINELTMRMYKLKEDLNESLNIIHIKSNEELVSRDKISKHLENITNTFNDQNKTFDQKINENNNTVHGIVNETHELENEYNKNIADIRHRIVRCDTSIASVNSDLRGNSDSLKQQINLISHGNKELMDKINQLESKMNELVLENERLKSKTDIDHHNSYNKGIENLRNLEVRLAQATEENKNNIHMCLNQKDMNIDKLATQFMTDISNIHNDFEHVKSKYEEKFANLVNSANIRFSKIEDNINHFNSKNVDIEQNLERRIWSYIDQNIKKNQDEINAIKKESRDGFRSVHESINSLRDLIESRVQIIEEQFKKEIGHIRKLIVLV
ncbi:hypothetical protein A3Q56_07371 [Intoshia linei]|uniref:Uncharacterized protein n=1 Tax=Intoshia linei TaxID=1819745 RepID=A0A177ASX8_9BILA|nr:hypothetical protein A3Q56_07371 [Intoshia linei]